MNVENALFQLRVLKYILPSWILENLKRKSATEETNPTCRGILIQIPRVTKEQWRSFVAAANFSAKCWSGEILNNDFDPNYLLPGGNLNRIPILECICHYMLWIGWWQTNQVKAIYSLQQFAKTMEMMKSIRKQLRKICFSVIFFILFPRLRFYRLVYEEASTGARYWNNEERIICQRKMNGFGKRAKNSEINS